MSSCVQHALHMYIHMASLPVALSDVLQHQCIIAALACGVHIAVTTVAESISSF